MLPSVTAVVDVAKKLSLMTKNMPFHEIYKLGSDLLEFWGSWDYRNIDGLHSVREYIV